MTDVNDIATRRLACEYLRRQARKLREHLDGAKTAKDIEDVHQVRVACRRLRAGLRLFADCFDSTAVNDWQKRTKKLLKSFGRARDLDVQILFLEHTLDGLSKKHKAMRPGIARMLLRRQQERQKVQKSVVRAVDKLDCGDLFASLCLEAEPPEDAAPVPFSAALAERFRRQSETYQSDVEQKLESLRDASDSQGHHDLRIAVKKLRYMLEIADVAYQGQLKKTIKKLKTLQTLLGDLHDCDIWMEEIDCFREDEQRRTLEYFGHVRPFGRLAVGLEFLHEQRQQQRKRLFEQAAMFAEELKQTKDWNRIRTLFGLPQ